MPPRYAYWTILVDNLPTAFRAATRDDLQPTFEQLRKKHPAAVMRWFARGKLWDSPEHAGREGREARERRDKGWRPGGDHRDPRERFELERKARNAARRQERFDQKSHRPRPDDTTRPPARDPREGGPDGDKPRMRPDDGGRPQARGPRDDRPRDTRDRAQRPPPRDGRSFENRGRPEGRGPRDDRPRDTRDRPQRPPPRDGRSFENRGRPEGRGPRDDRPRDTRDRPQRPPPRDGRGFENRGDRFRDTRDRERRPSGGGSRDGDRSGARPPREDDRAVRDRPVRVDFSGPRRDTEPGKRGGPDRVTREDRRMPAVPSRPRSSPPDRRRGQSEPGPAPPPGPDRPPRPGQEPPPVPARSEEIVSPPMPPERGRDVDGPAGTRLVKAPRRGRG